MSKPKANTADVEVSQLPQNSQYSSRLERFESIRTRTRTRTSLSGRIQSWTAAALLVSYLVFSVSLYSVLNQETTKVFWYLYLTIATLVAGATALEAYDGLTPLEEARKSIYRLEKDDQKFKTSDHALPLVELIVDATNGCDTDELNAIERIRTDISYPESLIRINTLCGENVQADPAGSVFEDHYGAAGVRTCGIPSRANGSLSSRLAYFLQANGIKSSSIVAIFSGDQRPNPLAVRTAVERLVQDNKIDVIQGRTVQVPQGRTYSISAALANVEHDMDNALLRPGQAITWGLNIADNTNTFWKIEALRAAVRLTSAVSRDGHDLAFAATSLGLKTVSDLSIICFRPCPSTFSGYLNKRTTTAREWSLAATRYLSLAFRKHAPDHGASPVNWSLKSRFAVIYQLLLLRIASHAVLQYLCLAIALLITRTPKSTLDFAYLICFPFPISEWLIVGG